MLKFAPPGQESISPQCFKSHPSPWDTAKVCLHQMQPMTFSWSGGWEDLSLRQHLDCSFSHPPSEEPADPQKQLHIGIFPCDLRTMGSSQPLPEQHALETVPWAGVMTVDALGRCMRCGRKSGRQPPFAISKLVRAALRCWVPSQSFQRDLNP